MRIVSLLPSATEIICEIGLGDRLVGVSHECDYPPVVRDLPKVTKTSIPVDASSREIDTLVQERMKTQQALYSFDEKVLEQLQPDLIVTQALCDVCAVAESEVNAAACLLPGRPKVINLEPHNLDEVFACMLLVGVAADSSDLAYATVTRLRNRVKAVKDRTRGVTHPVRVMVLEWIDPPFCAGHWTPELVRYAGGTEVFGQESLPSQTIHWEDIVLADPDVLVIACCGFDVQRTRNDLPILAAYPGFKSLSCVRTDSVYLMDGNSYFSRPGPRLVDGLEILAHALHPQIHPLPVGQTPAVKVDTERERGVTE
jgi:iron complex transport system substrate-binding protein